MLTLFQTFLVASMVTHIECFDTKLQRFRLRKDSSLSLQSASTGNDEGISRRETLQQWGGLALSSILLGTSPVAAEEGTVVSPRNIVITGSNSGIGCEASKKLAAQGHTVVLACRTLEKALDTKQRIEATGTTSGKLIPAECDLASLKSIDAFSKELPSMIGGSSVDTLCLNAGLARNTAATDIARTSDGFELTVGTNHLGHFYLNHLLLPMVNKSSGRIVVTASGVHDPESPGGAQGVPATLGDLGGLERDGKNFAMVDGNEFNADKAYKDSKLCNVLFTRELQRRLEANPATKGIVANCFNPGLIVSTGLFRDQNKFFTKAFDFIATDLAKVGETPAWGGGALAFMTAVETKGQYYTSPPGSSKYGDDAFGSQFTFVTPSKEAQDDKKAKRLWELSERLVGISA